MNKLLAYIHSLVSGLWHLLSDNLGYLFRLGEDAASEEDVIRGIETGVQFQGAKLWILILAIFTASLGLNTNSTAVIIGAMLISPLMGPILGMGLGLGIYDFQLLRRSWHNYIVATLFSVLTATFYFLITPVAEAQSELLARTSPTIYDVLIALCGGLAGIIALSSRSQRMGNVIPGVAIATALMPPLCTVGFGLATANWSFAAGAFYLYVINTIFIALATFVGAAFIMKFQKRTLVDIQQQKRVQNIITTITIATILPAIVLTFFMVRENTFNQRVALFIQQELHFPRTQIIARHINYDKRSFDIVLVGAEVDSTQIAEVQNRLPYYKLDDVGMQIYQSSQAENDIQELLESNNNALKQDELLMAQQQIHIGEIEAQLKNYLDPETMAPQLFNEMQALFPQVVSVATSRGIAINASDSVISPSRHIHFLIITTHNKIAASDAERLDTWLRHRITTTDSLQINILQTND